MNKWFKRAAIAGTVGIICLVGGAIVAGLNKDQHYQGQRP